VSTAGGERITFRETAAGSYGEAVVVEGVLVPGGRGLPAHVHPRQDERYEVLGGRLGFRVGKRRVFAGPGVRVSIPAGTTHAYWNAGPGRAHFVAEIRPALDFELLLASFFGLEAGARRDAPPTRLLRLAAAADAHAGTVRLPRAHRLLVALARPTGLVRGGALDPKGVRA
jgi:mannose-6-phosphate isomerase-like protein (cupin superfamily)